MGKSDSFGLVFWILLVVFQSGETIAQCTSVISGPSSACINQNLSFSTNEIGAQLLSWDYCAGDFQNSINSVQNLTTQINRSFHVEIVFDGTMYRGFVSNTTSDQIIRLDFINGLNQQPIAVPITVPASTFADARSIRIVKENGNWYGFVSDLSKATLTRMDFGVDILNTSPTYTNLNVSLSLPLDLAVQKDGDNYYALVLNFSQSYLTRVKLSLTMQVEEVSTINIGGINGHSISVEKVCDTWYGFVSLNATGRICRIRFGSALDQFDSFDLLSGYSGIRGIEFEMEADGYYIFASTGTGTLYRVYLGNDPMGVPISSDNLGTLITTTTAWDIEIYKDGSDWYLFIADFQALNRIAQFKFSSTCTSDIAVSTGNNPMPNQYSTSGQKKVTLLVRNANNGCYVLTHNVTVTSDLSTQVDFVAPSQSCLSVNTDFSALQDPSITSYNWDFGDGTNDFGPNVSHSYASNGSNLVKLDILNNVGCSNSITKPIDIFNSPIANFNLPGGLLCTNQVLFFSNNSTYDVGSEPTWEWLLDGVSISSDQDLLHSFTSSDPQEIILRASLPGCFNEISQIINTLQEGPNVDFSFIGQCTLSPTSFANNSIGDISTFIWDFGDGDTSSDINPNHTYSTKGTYNVTLQANSSNGCQNTSTQPITIYTKPQTNFFIALPPFSCSGSPSQFYDATPNPDDSNLTFWSWDFDDAGSTSLSQNPNHTYAQSGDYNVVLTVGTNFGCETTIQKTVTILPTPTINIDSSPTCQDIPVTFTGSSQVEISTWNWEIEGTLYYTPSISHTFFNAGNYTVNVNAIGTNNCINSTSLPITIASILEPDFTFDKSCVNQDTQFADITNTDLDPIEDYIWNFGDSEIGSGNPSVNTYSDQGIYEVELTVTTEGGCTYSGSKMVEITSSPVASFEANPDVGLPPLPVQFVNTSTQATSYLWEFHDGETTTTSTYVNPFVTYMNYGDYLVDLTAYNSFNCSSTATKIIQVRMPAVNVEVSNLVITEAQGLMQATITLNNKGNTILKNLPLKIDLGGFEVEELVKQEIEPGTTINYTIGFTILSSSFRGYLCVTADADGDLDLDDNKICDVLSSQLVVFYPYPNPSNGIVNLDWVSSQEGTTVIEVYDRIGNLFLSANQVTQAGINQLDLDMSLADQGIYFVIFQFDSYRKSFRIMVNN